MRRRMPQHVQPRERLGQHRFNLDRVTILLRRNLISEIDLLAVYARRQSLLRQVAIELLQSFSDRNRRIDLRGGTIFKLDVNLAHVPRSVRSEISIEPRPSINP